MKLLFLINRTSLCSNLTSLKDDEMEQLLWILCLSTMKSQVPRQAQVSEEIIFYSEC